MNGEMTPETTRNIIEGCTLMEDEGHAACETNIPVECRAEINKPLKENKDLFAKTGLELGRTDTVTCKLDTGDHPPLL